MAEVGRVPSIKGAVFGRVVESVVKRMTRDGLSRDQLARWLEPGDLDLLDQEIAVARWYDIRSYDRMNSLLLELEGNGDPEYFREQGRMTARQLMDAGLYSQLEYLNRIETTRKQDPQERFEAFGRDLRLLASLSGSILNFSRWTAKPDPDRELRYVIEVTEAEAMPESLCWRSDGFVNGMAALHGQDDLWGWKREAPGLVVFRMLRSI